MPWLLRSEHEEGGGRRQKAAVALNPCFNFEKPEEEAG